MPRKHFGLPLVAASNRAVWPDTAHEHVVAVEKQVLGGNRRGNRIRCFANEGCRIGRSDVLENDLQGREALDQPDHVLIDEALFAIEYVDIGTCDFAMDKQRHTDFGHRFQHWKDVVDRRYTRGGIRRGTGRVEFYGMYEACRFRGVDIARRRAFRQVKGHQRFEMIAGRSCVQNALAILASVVRCPHRRDKVGHDDRTGADAASVSHGMRKYGAIPKVNVPVIWA